MAGWMGTGKPTIAAAVAREVRFVVLAHDTTKSALLTAEVPHPPAGAASYEIFFNVAEDLLVQEHSVIIDSPSLYPFVPERGLALAARLGVRYYFVERRCPQRLAKTGLTDREFLRAR